MEAKNKAITQLAKVQDRPFNDVQGKPDREKISRILDELLFSGDGSLDSHNCFPFYSCYEISAYFITPLMTVEMILWSEQAIQFLEGKSRHEVELRN